MIQRLLGRNLYTVKQTKLDRMVEDIKAIGVDKNSVHYYNTGFTDECSLYMLSPAKPFGESAEAIGTIKEFWLPELFCSAPELALEVQQLREEVKRLRRGDETKTRYLSFALNLLTDEQDCEYTHFVGGLCTHDCCPEREEE